MTDLRTQRNVAAGAAVVALAVLIGFFVGRGGRETGEPGRPEVGADAPAAVAPAATVAPSPAAAVAPAPAKSAPKPAAGPSTSAPAEREPSSGRTAGERWTATEGTPPAADPPPAATSAPEPIRIPDGTQISLALTSPLSSQTAQVGDVVSAELIEAVVVDGLVALPAGTRVAGRVTEAHALAKIGGQARLAFSLETLFTGGREVPIAASFARTGKSETGKDAATIAAGAAIGIILGNQSKKNDRGKVIGGVLGGAAGTGVAAATKGETIELPAGTELRLTLRGAVTVPG